MSNRKLLHIHGTEHEVVRRWRRTKLTAVPRLDVLAFHLLGFYLERPIVRRGLAGQSDTFLGLLQLEASILTSLQLSSQL